jgi:hypothetical protein
VENLNLRHIYIIRFLIFFAFFARLASKFEKSTNMTFKKVSFLNLKTGVPKNAEFCADFKSVKKVLKTATKKSYKQNEFDEHEFKWKKCIFPSRFC